MAAKYCTSRRYNTVSTLTQLGNTNRHNPNEIKKPKSQTMSPQTICDNLRGVQYWVANVDDAVSNQVSEQDVIYVNADETHTYITNADYIRRIQVKHIN